MLLLRKKQPKQHLCDMSNNTNTTLVLTNLYSTYLKISIISIAHMRRAPSRMQYGLLRLLSISYANRRQDDGTAANYELPPPTKDGALPPPSSSADGTNQPNGHTPEDAEWERVGWAPRFGQLDGATDEGNTMLDHQTWVETKLDENFFGGRYKQGGRGGLLS